MRKWVRIVVAVLMVAILLLLAIPSESKAAVKSYVGSVYSLPFTTESAPNNYEINLSGEIVHIGSATSSFTPLIRFNRFGMESYVELNLVGGGSLAHFTTSSISNGIVTAENNYFILNYSAASLNPLFNELGGIDLKLTLKRVPPLNSITFTYNHQRANAYLQPPLTPEEIAQGASRPDYVVSSIAFYGDSNQVNNQYKTGKIGHLYRMRVTDANNNSTWADWGFGGGQPQITLTISQAFLDSAVYPVTITPVGDTFGYTGNGASQFYTGTINRMYTSSTTYTGGVGTGVSMSIRGQDFYGSNNPNVQMAVYRVSDDGLVNNATTGSVELVNLDWYTANFSIAPTFAAVSYYLVFNIDGDVIIQYDAVGDTNYRYQDYTFGSFPSTASWSFAGVIYKFSIYCTYTPSGGYDISNSPSSKDFGILSPSTTYWASGTDPLLGSTESIKAPTAQTPDGTGWTDPTYAYSSNNQYASATQSSSEDNRSPTANTNGTLAWTNPTNAYSSNNSYATATPTYGATTSWNPTANTNGLFPWTNPTNAYTSDGNYATASTLQTLTIYPDGSGGDPDSNTCAATYSTGTTFWGVVDEVSASDTDYYTMVTNGGGRLTMTFTAPTTSALPADAIIQSVVVNYRGNNSGTASFRPSMKIGADYYDALGTLQDPSAWTTYNDTLTTNPKTGAAWQASEINRTGGTSANYLNAFGTAGTDNNPDNQISWINLTVNFWYKDQIYNTFGITDPIPTSTITKVEIGYEAFATATQKLNLYTSADGGSTYSAAHLTGNLATTDPNAYTYVDVTADQTWTWTLLGNGSFKIKVATVWVNNTPTWSIDALVVRVTYDDRRQYDHIFGTFGFSGSATITKVEVGYEAFATATGQLDLYTSANGGSTWSSAHNTGNLGTTDPNSETWIDVTSDQTWTWTLLNDTNFKIKVCSKYASGTPVYSVDWISVRVTSSGTPSTIYGTYGYSITDVITKVEVGVEGYTSAGVSKNLAVYTSWDGGSSWSSKHTYSLPTSDPNSTAWIDCTADTSWTGTKVNDTNLKVKITHDAGDSSYEYVDYLPVRVTYDKTLTDAQCTFTITNSGSTAKINIKCTDFTGGGGWILTSGSPDGTHTRVTAYYSGTSSGLVLTTSDQQFIASLAASGTKKWDFKWETPTSFADGSQKSATITLTAVAP